MSRMANIPYEDREADAGSACKGKLHLLLIHARADCPEVFGIGSPSWSALITYTEDRRFDVDPNYPGKKNLLAANTKAR